MTLKAIITVGISGSGKTTFAEELCRKDKSFININRDDLRFSLTGARHWGEYNFGKNTEDLITNSQEWIAFCAYRKGKNIILSDTNLNPNFRKHWEGFLKDLGFEVEIKDFPVTVEEAIKRDQQRTRSVGYSVIHKQWKQWLEYIGHSKYTPDDNLPRAVIFDLDGTLADMAGNRTPYEWDKVQGDKAIEVIADMAYGYSEIGYKIIICSGRSGVCKADSEEWLKGHGIPYDAFYIREANDYRKDEIIKAELFWDWIAPNFAVQAVVDDRPKVCRMWRDLGLKVIQVADPYKEF